MDLSELIDLAIGGATLLGMIASSATAVFLVFRRRIRRWWTPYRSGLDALSEVPAMREGIDACQSNLAEVRASMGLIAMHMRARSDINIRAAEFETGEDGANTYVSQTYARWLGVGKNELLGWGWVNFIHPEDRARVRREWDQCRVEHRVYTARHRIVTSDGDVIDVETLVSPIPDSPPAMSWLGVMRKVSS